MMYAVFFSAGQYDDAYTTLVCVTATEDSAKDLVTLANLEYEEARKVPTPHRLKLTTGRKEPNWSEQIADYNQRREEYKEKLQSIMTVDGKRARERGLDPDGEYHYEEVEVR